MQKEMVAWWAAGAMLFALGGVHSQVRAANLNDYVATGSFMPPVDPDRPNALLMDTLPDGRLVVLAGTEVHVESDVASRSFDLLGELPDADLSDFGAAFCRVSPDGTHIAVGNSGGASFVNYEVGVFNLKSLTGTWFTANHFDAEWIDNTHLVLTAGEFGSPATVTVLDAASPDPMNPINPVIIENIGGASSGVAFDADGNLFTGNGFASTGPSTTGAVKGFPRAEWMQALGGGPIIDFEAAGALVVDVLSASPLAFDGRGNLLVGGGDFNIAEVDFAALVRASTVRAALMGAPPADAGDPAQLRRLDPDADNDFNFYAVNANPVTNELYLLDAFASPNVYTYAVATPQVPTASTWSAIVATLVLICAGAAGVRAPSTMKAPVPAPVER